MLVSKSKATYTVIAGLLHIISVSFVVKVFIHKV